MKASSRTQPGGVKARRGWARHFEGWQPGLLAIFVAGVPTLLAVPRPVAPSEIPEPFLEPRVLSHIAAGDEALASAAEHERLDTDVRALGSALRAYNVADTEDDAAAVVAARGQVAEAARRASAQGEAALVRLRAYQLRSFQRELLRYEATGEESAELREVAGPFLSRAAKSGWIEGHHILPDASVRAALFKKRWNEIALAHGGALDLAPMEQRAVARFLLIHPPKDAGGGPSRDALGKDRTSLLADQYRLKKIDELRTLDPRYPADLARGIVLYRLHRIPLAVESLRKHLDEHPDGPYGIRAQNYLRAMLGADSM